MSGTVSYHLTAADLTAAYNAHMRKMSAARLSILLLFAVCCGVFLSGLDGFRSTKDILVLVGIMLVWVLIVLAIIIFGVRGIWLKRFSRRIYAQQREYHGEIRLSWDDTGFKTKTLNGESIVAWSELFGWKQTDVQLLLYRSEALFHFIPIEKLPSDVVPEIAALLIANGVKARKP